MEKKYELFEETIKIISWYHQATVHRIRALKDFGDVKKGDIGGFVSSETNLSHDGTCWIYDDAVVLEHAKVSDDASVHNNAKVMGNATVKKHAKILDDATIRENAFITDDACICDNATIIGYASIYGQATISQCGSVVDRAMVSGSSQIRNRALIGGRAVVSEDSLIMGDVVVTNARIINGEVIDQHDYVCIEPIGSRNDRTTFYYNRGQKIILVSCGCFNKDIDAFEKQVIEKHHGSMYEQAYLHAIQLAKATLVNK